MQRKDPILLYMILLIAGMTLSELTTKSMKSLKRKDKLVIKYCPKKYTVLENMPEGTAVGRVLASNPVGTVTYSTLEMPTKIPFQINNKTGMITTKEIFDRDEPSNQVKFLMTVEAIQSGNPTMHAYCGVEITILDTNDNPPVFIKQVFLETIRRDVEMGEKVMQLSAIDIDDGENAIVTYSISALYPDDIKFFRIDSMTGEIFWAENIHTPAEYIFQLLGGAKNIATSFPTTTVSIEIRVAKSDRSPPSFNMQSPISINLAEDFNHFEMSALNFEVTSNVEGDPFVSCDLLTGTMEQTNRDQLFNLRMSTNMEGSIQVLKPFDYERIGRYFLILRATNRDNWTSEIEIIVNIEDVNDNPPILQHFSPLIFQEGIEGGIPLVKIYATDADRTIINTRNEYQLANYRDLFSIDRSTGLLTTLKRIDRNQTESPLIFLKVFVNDVSGSIVYTNQEKNQYEHVYDIYITPK